MLPYHNISPVFLEIGPLQLRWYSLMYVIGMVTIAWFLRRSSKQGTLAMSFEQVEGLMVSGIVGMIVGARLTYCLVYNPEYYLEHWIEIPAVWQGGLSFHGALVGICLACLWYCKKNKIPYLNVMDHVALVAPIGLGFGRIGNFINGELWGRVSDVPWAMVFPEAGDLPRHPSQLYQSFTEGLILFLFLWFVQKKYRPIQGVISACFILGYGFLRFFIEFFREPDSQLGFILGPLSMGQLLCILMIVFGIGMVIFLHKNQKILATDPSKHQSPKENQKKKQNKKK